MRYTYLCLPSYSWYLFTDSGGMEGWVGLQGGWLRSETVYPSTHLTCLPLLNGCFSNVLCSAWLTVLTSVEFHRNASVTNLSGYVNIHRPKLKHYLVQAARVTSCSLTCTACGGSLTAEHGQFTSPRYPDPYLSNVECVWNISVSPGNRLRIAFRYWTPYVIQSYIMDCYITETDGLGDPVKLSSHVTLPLFYSYYQHYILLLFVNRISYIVKYVMHCASQSIKT